jgi:integrase/recombinase XerD
MTLLAPTLEAFFTDRLLTQRRASPHTVAAYRDTFRLLLGFAHQRTGKPPSRLDFDDLDATLIGAFLQHLESDRRCSVRTRNTRLAAVHSLFQFASLRHPEHAASIARVLAIPTKRYTRNLVCSLTPAEVDALLASPDRTTWLGRRDHALLLVATESGLRVSELTGLRREDIHVQAAAYLRCVGKGRKERTTPLTTQTAGVLRGWLRTTAGQPDDPAFPRPRGAALSRDAVRKLVDRHVTVAARQCPSLGTKHVSPHTLRHTAALRLLQAGVDTSVIALWLGHADVRTTQIYLNADLALKEQALARTAPPNITARRYKPDDSLLAFLEAL